MTQYAVFGCGPAGLIAANAIEQMGHQVDIISRKQKSVIPGSQHLQARIPGVTEHYPEYTVEFVRLGTAEGYARKVYGDPTHPCGWESYRGVHPSWSVYKAYDRLWERYSERIVHVDSLERPQIEKEINYYGAGRIFSTIPQPQVCYQIGKHFFEGVPYFIKPLEIPPDDYGREIVVWNGIPGDEWYRWSILGERCSIESTHPMEGALEGRKAIYNNCNCYPEIHRVGRWAKWKHGVLLHHVYTDVINRLGGQTA